MIKKILMTALLAVTVGALAGCGNLGTKGKVEVEKKYDVYDLAVGERTEVKDMLKRDEAKPALEKATIYIAGDSTASIYEEERYPRTGWGQVFQDFFYDNIKVSDVAVSGRSSRSFIDEGYFDQMAGQIKKGDYLFIQFGHNDQKKDERHTDPFTTYKEYLTRYVKLARDKGATPVLLTSIHRLKYNDEGKLKDTHKEYLTAVRELGKELGVPVFDIAAKTEDLYNKLGYERARRLYMMLEPGEWPNYPDGRKDATHLTEQGAYIIGYMVREDIKNSDLALKDSLKVLK